MKAFWLVTSEDKLSIMGASRGTTIVPKDTLLILVRGMTLRRDVPVCITTRDMAFNQDVKALLPKNINPIYLGYFLASRKSQLLALVNQAGHGTGRLQSDLLATFPVWVPKPSEQEAIACLLQTWDRAIDLTERLISTKEVRRKWLMQQLMTGKRRLSGFRKPWKEVSIGEILREVKRPVKWDDSHLYRLISLRRRSEGLFLRDPLYGSQIKTKKMNITEEGDFLISKMQIVHGASGIVTDEFAGLHISDSYIILRSRNHKSLDIRFFSWLAKLPLMYHHALFSSYGVHIEKMTFNLSDYLKRKILIPTTTEEQMAIVGFFSAVDRELDLLRQKLAALREQKKGLMQQLLTGKVRVKVGDEKKTLHRGKSK
jgi:type I restriction enzyme, S subunit